MASEVLITSLPSEIIDQILESDELTFSDICNFRSTCKQFRSHCFTNKFWRIKCFKRWPSLWDHYEPFTDANANCQTEDYWLDVIRKSINFKNNADDVCFIIITTHNFFRLGVYTSYKNSSDCAKRAAYDLYSTFGNNGPELTTMIDELRDDVNGGIEVGCKIDSFTNYMRGILQILIKIRAKAKWRFWSLKPDQVPLEKIAMLVAEWTQPRELISYSGICASLGDIAKRVLEKLKIENPKHPIFDVPREVLIGWERENLEDNQFNSADSKEILDLIVNVMFVQMRFRTWKIRSFEHMCLGKYIYHIKKVLSCQFGSREIVSIVFQSVARRLGVRCDFVSFSANHFFLRWRESYTESFEACEFFYLNLNHSNDRNAKLVPKDQCPDCLDLQLDSEQCDINLHRNQPPVTIGQFLDIVVLRVFGKSRFGSKDEFTSEKLSVLNSFY